MKTLLKGGMVYTPEGFRKRDIAVSEGKVFAVSDNIDDNNIFEKVIRCDNFFVVPGFIDVHVHLREPGFEYKETIKTGTEAAAAGGYTTVCPMPNLKPAPVDAASLKVQTDIIESDGLINVYPYGAITSDQSGRGKLSAMKEMSDKVVAYTDDGKGVQDEKLMTDAMNETRSLGKLIAAHCEDESFPTEDPASEWKQAARDISLAMQTGCPYHICHVSAKETVQLVRAAKGAGIDITCETAPHYLIFTDEDVKDEGQFKMNPPIRKSEDREELIQGLKDGTIDMIATDHAPHRADEKKGGFKGSLFGIVGLETAFPVLYTDIVEKGIITLEKLVDLMSTAPAKRFLLPGGVIEEGAPADLTIIDPNAEYVIDPDTFKSKGRSTPFKGMKVKGMITATICGGKTVYER
ncbi:MAG: dihydroorotase [Eubacteriaceae bacterium]|nr:dihydroorotase [Eubacteriaceae bacterium]